MDLRRYKCPVPRRVPVGGAVFELAALPQSVMHDAEQRAKNECRVTGSALADLNYHVFLLAAAAGVSVQRIRQLHADQLMALLRAWNDVQDESMPRLSRMSAAMKLAVLDDPEMAADGAVAHAATSASDYYGMPVGKITMGQLAYWMLLKSAYHELHVDQSDRKVSRRWLEQQAKSA